MGKIEEILAEVGIYSVDDFMAIDPFGLYAKIKPMKGMGLNFIYAIIGGERKPVLAGNRQDTKSGHIDATRDEI